MSCRWITGSLYPALHRLLKRGWINGTWGISTNNRRAMFYALAVAGRRHLVRESIRSERMVEAAGRVMRLAACGKSPAAFDRPCIPPGLRCLLVAYAQYAPSSRLASRAPDRSRCDAGFHHGLLADANGEPR